MPESIKVPLYGVGGVVAHATIDEDCAALVEGYRWNRNHYGYAAARKGGRKDPHTVWMHRLIVGLERGDPRVVDHINHDKTDNRRANLRVVTPGQNCQHRNGLDSNNTSGFRGVRRNPCSKQLPWFGQVHHRGKGIYCGSFATKEEAATAAAAKRRELGFLGA